MDINIGDKLHGFIVRQIDRVELFGSRVIQFDHEATGLRLLHVHNDDAENLFSVVFPTPPHDDTGIPHILEHSVLAGSEKYPAREGFFELYKRSLATFINAMTAQEHTLYPVSSTVPKDLFNLAEVYWDAVFHPLLSKHTFRREGHRLELATPADLESELIVKGIVYSEMQGAYSAPESQLEKVMGQGLFPDSIYGLDSGGDPQIIPDLAYEDLLAFHAKYYSPSHALVVAYGNLPTETYLRFVAERLTGQSHKLERIQIKRQPRFTAPRRLDARCAVDAAERGRAWLALGWICGDGTDPVEAMQLRLLQLILLGHPGAVLRKAILDAKLGDDLAMSYMNTKTLDATFTVGVRGAEAKRANEFEAFVLSQLEELANRGIASEAIETACQQLAYSTLAINDQFPVGLLWNISTQYVLTGDPVAALRAAEHLKTVRERALKHPEELVQLLRERLLDNPHRLLVVVEGDPDYATERDAALVEKLRSRKAALPTAALQELVAEAREFEQLEQVSDAAAFDGLPTLGRADLPRQPRSLPTSLESDGRFEFLTTQVFANGINYLQLDIDFSHLEPELLPYVGFYLQCLGRIGTHGRSWADTAARVASVTSGIGGWVQLDGHATDHEQLIRTVHVSTSFLDGRGQQALGLLEELLFQPNLEDRDRLGELLIQMRAQNRAQLADHASQLARCHAARPLSPEAWLSDENHGVSQLRRMDRLASGFAAHHADAIEQTVAALKRVRDALAKSRGLVASFTGSQSERAGVQSKLATWLGREPAAPSISLSPLSEALPRRVGLAGAMDVGFCSLALRGPAYTDPASAALAVATTYFSQYYLMEEIRLRGSAYGASCGLDAFHRFLVLGSYRDPQVARTIGIFGNAAASANGLEWSEQDIERAVLVTAKDALLPNRPSEATRTALWWHVHGVTNELRQRQYDRILSVDATKAKRSLCDLFEQQQGQSSLCVVASREKLEQSNALLGSGALTIEDVYESVIEP